MPWLKPNSFCFQICPCSFFPHCFDASNSIYFCHQNVLLLSSPLQSKLNASFARKANLVFPDGSLPPSWNLLGTASLPLLVQKILAQEPAAHLPLDSGSISAQPCSVGNFPHLCNGYNISHYRKDEMSPNKHLAQCLVHKKIVSKRLLLFSPVSLFPISLHYVCPAGSLADVTKVSVHPGLPIIPAQILTVISFTLTSVTVWLKSDPLCYLPGECHLHT